MKKLAAVLRLICLSILFGGSVATVFAAVILIKAAEAQGIPALEAARSNAPIFISFGKFAFGTALVLLAVESFDITQNKTRSKADMIRYGSSFAAIATSMIFALGIVPGMEQLSAIMATNPQAHEDFHKLHEVSRMIFGGTILFALISLVTPTLAKNSEG